MPSVESVPIPADVRFKPCAEIHLRRIRRNSDIAQVARAVACWNVHASTQSDSEMSEVSTDARSFLVTFEGGAIASGKVVAELNAVVHIIANGLNPLPASVDLPERGPSKICQLLRIAVTAAQQIY